MSDEDSEEEMVETEIKFMETLKGLSIHICIQNYAITILNLFYL